MLDHYWSIKFGYYITYFGDVYFGIAYQPDYGKDDFFVISKFHYAEFSRSDLRKTALQDLQKVGVWVKNPDIIDKWIEEYDYIEDKRPIVTGRWPEVPSKSKIMYVFGAGASSNCSFGEGLKQLKDSTLCPPLGTELFNPRYEPFIENYPGLQISLPKFEEGRNDIETILENDWNELNAAPKLSLAAEHIQLQFYAAEIFEAISKHVSQKHYRFNLYSRFLQKLYSRSLSITPIFVSFNYDTILDRELEKHFNVVFQTIESYTDLSKQFNFLYFKPHGSWNWGWKFNSSKLKQLVSNRSLPQSLYEKRITPAKIYYDLLGNTEMLNGWNQTHNDDQSVAKCTLNKDHIILTKDRNDIYPALLLPYRDKDEFVLPHIQQLILDDSIKHIEELVLIGWKGNEKLFNKKLKEKAERLKKITIVNPDFENVGKELSNYLDLGKYELVHIKGFEAYVLGYMK